MKTSTGSTPPLRTASSLPREAGISGFTHLGIHSPYQLHFPWITGTPALFRQGLPAGMRLAIFASLSVVLMLVDGKMQTLEAFRESIASYVIRPAEAVTEGTVDALASGGKFFTTVSSLTEENEQLKKKNAQLSFDLLEFNRLKAENAQLQSMAGVRSSVHISSLVGVIQGETADAFTHHLVSIWEAAIRSNPACRCLMKTVFSDRSPG